MIYILLSALIAVSLVSASELGQELVTCGDFSCATPSDFWSNFGTETCEGKWFILGSDILAVGCISAFPTNTNTSQDIEFKAERSYNVTLDIRALSKTGDNLTIFISDNSTTFVGIIGLGNTIKSFFILKHVAA